MRTFWSRHALAVLLFGLGWAMFNWPFLSLIVGAGLPSAMWRVTAAWGAALAGLFLISGVFGDDAREDGEQASMTDSTPPPAVVSGKTGATGGD